MKRKLSFLLVAMLLIGSLGLQAFAAEVLETIEHEGLRQALMDTTLAWLGRRR